VIYGSLFTGIGGFDLAFDRAGMECGFQCEIDPACATVLARHWPTTPRFHDIQELHLEPGAVDLLCGGFPCQDLSVAGAKVGLDGTRSRLFWEYARLIGEAQPRWVVLENVPGLLSSNGGRDMGTVVGTLAQLGFGWAYRVLDAQYFGVPQRRRRVFIVGHSGGDWRRACEVLFDGDGVRRDPPARRTPGQKVGSTLGGGSGNRGWCSDTDRMTFIPSAVKSRDGKGVASSAEQPLVVTPTLHHNYGKTISASDATLRPHVLAEASVRRLLPLECERLQGFPDGWTDQLSDSARYRCLGNAVAVPVVEWIARRLAASE